MCLHVVKTIYTQQRSKSINIDEIRTRPPTDMNLVQWVIPWSHIVGEVISTIERASEIGFLNLNCKNLDLKTHMLSSTLIDYRRRNWRDAIFFSEELQMLPETFFLEEFCFVVK